MSLALEAERAEPHVHLDNRALFLSAGAQEDLVALRVRGAAFDELGATLAAR